MHARTCAHMRATSHVRAQGVCCSICPGGSGVPAMAWPVWTLGPRDVYVGQADHALDWAEQHSAAIVNCAHIDYDWAPSCDRRWLNLNFRGSLNGRTWAQRVEGCLRFAFAALERSEPVLFHCRQGKHRSGAASAIVIALLEGISYGKAVELYVSARGLGAYDAAKCEGIGQKLDLHGLVAGLQEEGFCASQIQAVTRYPSPAVPKRMPTQGPKLPLQPGSGVPASAGPSSPLRPKPPPGPPPVAAAESTTTTAAKAMATIPRPSSTPRGAYLSPGSGVLGSDASRSRSRSRSRRSRSRSHSPQLTDDRAWQCPVCDTINPRSKMRCTSRSCGARRPLLQRFRDGDWFCQECGNHNFKCRSICNNPHCTTVEFKPGDWMCPRCNNLNFASRLVCNTKKCRLPKP